MFTTTVFDRSATIRTPENIELSYRIAGIGTRGAAYFVDLVILFAMTAVVSQFANHLPVPGNTVKARAAWLAGIVGMLLFVLTHGYFVWWEWQRSGQSPGKRALGIRVIKEGGYALSFTDALLRNLLRLADFLPFLNAAGLASVFLTPRGQRLGDLAAGTLVVHQDELLADALSPRVPPSPKTAPVLPSHELLRLPADVLDLAVEFFRYVDTLVPASRQDLAVAIVELIGQTSGLAPAPGQSSEGFLAAVVNQGAPTAPAPADPGAGIPPHSAASARPPAPGAAPAPPG